MRCSALRDGAIFRPRALLPREYSMLQPRAALLCSGAALMLHDVGMGQLGLSLRTRKDLNERSSISMNYHRYRDEIIIDLNESIIK